MRLTMYFRVVQFVLLLTTVSLVESKCRDLKLLSKDYKQSCEEWWNKVAGEVVPDSDAKSCVNLIKEKCPSMIEVTKTLITRDYDVKDFHYETLSYRVEATRSTERKKILYYEYEKKELCWDDDGTISLCDYWWKVATDLRAKSKYRQTCIERILRHCPDMITYVEEDDGECVQRCLGGYRVKVVTFRDKYDNRASYDKHVPL